MADRRPECDAQFRRDFLGRFSFGDEAQDLDFAARQTRENGVRGRLRARRGLRTCRPTASGEKVFRLLERCPKLDYILIEYLAEPLTFLDQFRNRWPSGLSAHNSGIAVQVYHVAHPGGRKKAYRVAGALLNRLKRRVSIRLRRRRKA